MTAPRLPYALLNAYAKMPLTVPYRFDRTFLVY